MAAAIPVITLCSDSDEPTECVVDELVIERAAPKNKVEAVLPVISLASDSDESPECVRSPKDDDNDVVCLGVRAKRQRGESPLPVTNRRRLCQASHWTTEPDDNEVVYLGVGTSRQSKINSPAVYQRQTCTTSNSSASFFNEFIDSDSGSDSELGTDTDTSDCFDSFLDFVVADEDIDMTARMDKLMHEAECHGHQREGCLDTNQLRVIRLIRAAKDAGRSGFAILWALGGGKTRAAIGSLTKHPGSGKTKALALVPLAVMAQWKAEARVLGVKAHIYHGSANHRQLDPHAELTVITRETLAAEMRCRYYHVLCQPWTEIIVDEAHRFANLRARAGEKTRDYAKVISRLQQGRHRPFFTALTGTPASIMLSIANCHLTKYSKIDC